MKHLVSALALTALLTIPATAGTKIDDPVKFITGVYAHWAKNQNPQEDIYTARLKALMDLDVKEADGQVGRANDFSFWCNCQDGDIKNAVIKGWDVPDASPARKVVDAKFLLEGKKQDILFYFEKTAAGWKLDDVQSRLDITWTLSVICKYGFPESK